MKEKNFFFEKREKRLWSIGGDFLLLFTHIYACKDIFRLLCIESTFAAKTLKPFPFFAPAHKRTQAHPCTHTHTQAHPCTHTHSSTPMHTHTLYLFHAHSLIFFLSMTACSHASSFSPTSHIDTLAHKKLSLSLTHKQSHTTLSFCLAHICCTHFCLSLFLVV